MHQSLELVGIRVENEAVNRGKAINAIKDQNSGLQNQITGLQNLSQDKEIEVMDKGKQDLTAAEFLNLRKNFKTVEGCEYDKVTFEAENQLIDWNKESLQEPRQLTIKNVRDIVFSLLNQSIAQKRISQSEVKIGQLFEECKRVNRETVRLEEKMNANKIELSEQHNRFYIDEFCSIRSEYDEKFQAVGRRDKKHAENIDNNKKSIEDLFQFRDGARKQFEQTDKKIRSEYFKLHELLTNCQADLESKIETIEKQSTENFENSMAFINKQSKDLAKEIEKTKDEFETKLQTKIEGLEKFVTTATDKVNTNNDGIYEKYDEKLRRIKDVCAQYFSKYEKHLINHQTIVRDLEKQQEQWVKMLIQPQELNQARLYAIETRIKEGENNKMRDTDFLKETMKKLIYAIEQQQISTVKASNVNIPKDLQAMASKEFDRGGLMSAGGASGSNGYIGSAYEYASSPIRGKSPPAGSVPTSSDILFLKRLLYLKAAIDNETTINTFSVPFEQEKLRDYKLSMEQQAMMVNGSDKLHSLDHSRHQLEKLPELEDISYNLPNTSHGFRLRNAIAPNTEN